MADQEMTLFSKLAAAKAAKFKCAGTARRYNAKAKRFKSRSLAKMCSRKARMWKAEEAELEKQIMQLVTEIEIYRVRKALESNKSGITTMFRGQLEGAQLRQFDACIENEPDYAVTVALHNLAKSRAAHVDTPACPTTLDPREFSHYRWNGCDVWIVPEEAVQLLIPALARGPHKDPVRASDIVSERLAALGIDRADGATDQSHVHGWRQSVDGRWDAQLSAFVRDLVPVLPAIKEAIDKCTGCKTCLAARRQAIETVLYWCGPVDQ
ncbi:hypothetical protein BCR44DRAFT_1428643 [Catenaria anguillulae PL171]|uniref:Uncharacterized protein n=1 Tax=Catenaria anguillulae PL171 TaxID=765915 RepID=A0A1Y2HVI7_9FUNG|nr:hypothetical protein BCR44DRAFT_1428643 [Catenaria anguillulae PL171]